MGSAKGTTLNEDLVADEVWGVVKDDLEAIRTLGDGKAKMRNEKCEGYQLWGKILMSNEVAVQPAIWNSESMQDHQRHRALVLVPAPPYQAG